MHTSLLLVLGLACCFATSAGALTVAWVDTTTPTQTGLGLASAELVATAGGGEHDPIAFEVNASGVRQEYLGGAAPTPDMTAAGALLDPSLDTHMLFGSTDWVAFNGADGAAGAGSTFSGNLMSLVPSSVPGSSFAFFHVVYPAGGPVAVSGLVAAPGMSAPAAFNFAIPVPAALPLGLAGLGVLAAARRRWVG